MVLLLIKNQPLNGNAQYNVGWMYFKGEGIQMDKNKAALWINKSKNQGNAKAKSVWKQFELEKYLN
jgi:TPR repeat protein